MTPEESLRRQLRFSLFLQSAAALMFGVALVVQIFATGLDGLTILFGVAFVLLAILIAFTASRLRRIP